MAAEPRVELLWWRGCPSWEEALALLREEMEAAGIDPGALDVREIRTDRDAELERFVGSPTIRVDGRDLQPPGDEPIGLTCRVYRLRDGRISPLPDRAEVREALSRRDRGGGRLMATGGRDARSGRSAPPLELPDTDGNAHRLPAPGEAPATVVIWTCNHCPYALAWHDRLVEAADDYGPRGVALLGRQLERRRALSRATRWTRCESGFARSGGRFPYLHDESQEAARAWAAQVTPHVYVLDGDLRIRYEGAAGRRPPGSGPGRRLAAGGARRRAGRARPGAPGHRARRMLDQVEALS